MQKTAICENERKINGEEKVTEIRYIKGIKQQIETERKVKTKTSVKQEIERNMSISEYVRNVGRIKDQS